MRKIKRIMCHHSLTKDSGTVSWSAVSKYHTETLGWKYNGYHAGTELITSGGELYYETFMGRMWDISGGHVRGHNRDSLGLCFIGNYDLFAPADDMLIVGSKIIKLWMKLFDIKISEVYGHRDFSTKSCPGTEFDMDKLKYFIRHPQ